MATNIEIIKKACEGSAYWRVEGIPSLTQILDEARADERAKVQSGKLTEVGQSLYDRRKHIEAHTANQIFAELKAAAWQQIEPDKLKQFYKEFSEAKDEKAALEIAQKFSIVGFSAKKFDAIQKKYGVLK